MRSVTSFNQSEQQTSWLSPTEEEFMEQAREIEFLGKNK